VNRRSAIFAALNTVKNWQKWRKWSVEKESWSSDQAGNHLAPMTGIGG
jgi:hypothetical protein